MLDRERLRDRPAGRMPDEMRPLDPERIRLWTFARAVENVLWCYESGEGAAESDATTAPTTTTIAPNVVIGAAPVPA